MVRTTRRVRGFPWSSPHPRGDGPCASIPRRNARSFSPPAWGWSASPLDIQRQRHVLPTRVGMVRVSKHYTARSHRSPHPRGDGPPSAFPASRQRAFSPPAWGWSGDVFIRRPRRGVLPTRVGMVRPSRQLPITNPSSPHPRGDGPFIHAVPEGFETFSPPAWGWSASRRSWPPITGVLPTRVGMVRSPSS